MDEAVVSTLAWGDRGFWKKLGMYKKKQTRSRTKHSKEITVEEEGAGVSTGRTDEKPRKKKR